MALGIKKITESVIEEGRALITIGNGFNDNEDNGKGKISVNDNQAIDPGGLFTYNSLENGGILRIKTAYDEQDRINADQTLSFLSVTTRVIGNQAVTTDKIKDSAVTENKIMNNAVTTNKIKNGAVTNSKLAADSVTTEKIKDAAVTMNKIKNSSVTSDKIAKDAVVSDKIKNDCSKECTTKSKKIEYILEKYYSQKK